MRWLVEELGYDIAINYKDVDWYEQLVMQRPNGSMLFSITLAEVFLTKSLRLIGMHGVVLLCGSTSQYSEEEMSGPSNYIWLGTMRARMQGFVIFDYAERYPEARAKMARWIRDGRLKIPSYEMAGDVDAFPEAFQQLYQGKNLGKMLLKLPAAT